MHYQIEVKKHFDGVKTTHRNRIYRQNVKLEGPDIVINFPFHGETDPSDGKLKVLAHEDSSHPDNTVFRRKTIRCRFPQCPKDNILWTDYKRGIPYLEKNGELIPSGWWKYSTEHIEKTFDTFLSDINDELDVIREGDGKRHGFKDRSTNDDIDRIIREHFPKSLPGASKDKLHNILWYLLNSGEGLRVYHIMLSPPQDQDYLSQNAYIKLKQKANRLFIKAGGWGGVMVMHHARVRDRFNDPDSPSFKGFERRDDGEGFHFHAIGLGFFRYEEWESSGWVIKNLSYNEKEGRVIPVKSVRATAEYLLEHCSVVSKKVSKGSLSCHTAFSTPLIKQTIPSNLTTFDLTYSYISDRDHEKIDTIQKPYGIGNFPISIVSGNNEIAKKSHTRKVRNYSAYWFIGCLKNLKIPEERTKCALTDHEIKRNTEFRMTLHEYKEVKVPFSRIGKLLKEMTDPFMLEFHSVEQYKDDIRKIMEGTLYEVQEFEIDPMELEKIKGITKIPTGIDKILSKVDEPQIFGRRHNESKFDLDAIKEACYRFKLSDPAYAWFRIPHGAYYTDVLDPDASPDKLRMNIEYYSYKQRALIGH